MSLLSGAKISETEVLGVGRHWSQQRKGLLSAKGSQTTARHKACSLVRSSAWYAKTCDVTKSLGRLWLLHLLSICDDPPTSSCSSYTTAKATITTATTNTKNNDDDDADDDDRNNVNAAAAAPVAQRDRACLSRSCRSGPKAVFGLQHVGLSLPESLLSRTKTLERRPWLWLRSL